MRTEKRPDGWWIAEVPAYAVDGEICTSCGPYTTKDEAAADLAGLTRFHHDHPEFTGDAIPTPIPETPQADEAPRPETTTRVTQRSLFG